MNSGQEREAFRTKLQALQAAEQIQSIDVQFALYIYDHSDEVPFSCGALACCLSAASSQGSVCLGLSDLPGLELWRQFGVDLSTDAERERLLRSSTVGSSGDYVPLLVDADNIYIHRYWSHETHLAEHILSMSSDRSHVPVGKIAELLADLPISPLTGEPEWDTQALAVVLALQRRFCVISGGPGTGKTTTVARIVAALVAASGAKRLRIGVAAPTGKAAARLDEALAEKLDPEIQSSVDRATTIHRLLGYNFSEGRFRHNNKHRLPHDVVIVDEASMVDLPLMSRLAGALRASASMILLGDKDQLASVQAGSVLADICRDAAGFSQRLGPTLELISGRALPQLPGPASSAIGDCVVLLDKSYRFDAQSGIGQLAAAIQASDFQRCESILSSDALDLCWRSGAVDHDALEAVVPEAFLQALREPDVDLALAGLDSFRILCAEKLGRFGVAGMNEGVEALLRHRGLAGPAAEFYMNQLIMVNRNDYQQQLFNGEVGIVRHLLDGDHEAQMCYFPPTEAETGPRPCIPARLPEWNTAFALTVHKSQGSEFDEVLIVVPPTDSPVLTKELLYTAVTRARKKVTLWCSRSALRSALARPASRHSGLTARLRCKPSRIV